MGGKLSPIIIVFLLIIVVIMGLFVFKVIQDQPDTENKASTVDEDAEPQLSFEQQPEEDKKSVTIVATALVEDGSEIEKIILPDNSEIPGESAKYVVNENGKYEFTAVGVNGKKVTSTVTVNDIENVVNGEPYLPDGFSVISDNVEEGYTIADKEGNQYVWVPVESGKLSRSTMFNTSFEDNASELVNSVAQYYGFYIGRFEASQYEYEQNGELQYVAASMAGKVPWTGVSYQDAFNTAAASAKAFGYSECTTSLINSYAWDTTLEWLDKDVINFSSSLDYGNYGSTVYPTGTTKNDEKKHICDLSGNVKEWTTEIDKTSKSDSKDKTKKIYRIVRGGCANLPTIPASRKGYAEDNVNDYWGFRLILYK